MFLKSSAVLATAVAALFLVGVSAEQAAAQRDGGRSGGGGGPSIGGGGGGGGGGGRSFSGGGGGGRSFSGGGVSSRSFGGGGRNFGGSGGYIRGDRGSRFAAPRDGVRSPRVYRHADGRHRHFRRRNGVIVYGAPYYYDSYGYGSCGYFYSRAIATNSSYWWNRYYSCVGYW